MAGRFEKNPFQEEQEEEVNPFSVSLSFSLHTVSALIVQLLSIFYSLTN